MSDRDYRYRPAWWLRSAHAQTMWGRFARRIPSISTTVERLTAADGDNLELHHLAGRDGAPRVLLLHGLEGSARSHYVGGMFSEAARRGWKATMLVFRGCGSEPNAARRFYHSGETQDLQFVFTQMRVRWPLDDWLLIGVSLGGNVLLKWLGERGMSLDARVRAAAAISVPFDLEAGARCISRGFARIYDHSFLRSLRRKALVKLDRFPDLFDREKLQAARSVFEFDDAVTAPVHGFANAVDYYRQSSSLAFLDRIAAPTLLLSSSDDPFLPSNVLARVALAASYNVMLTTEFHRSGGHVGFIGGALPWRAHYYAEWRAFRFFDQAMERR